MHNLYRLKKVSSIKGQAYVEFLLVLPLLILFLAGIYFFSMIFIVHARLLIAARHAAWLIVHANYNELQLKNEIKDFLGKSKPVIKIKDEDINIGFGSGHREPAFVNISYRLPIPKVLAKIKNFPKKFVVNGRCEVFNNSWYYGRDWADDVSKS